MGLWIHHDEEPSKHPTARVTADGVTVRVGDRVWTCRLGIGMHRTTLRVIDIGYRWSTMWERHAYVDEGACIRAAIEERKRLIAKARNEIRSAKLYTAKLRARLKNVESTKP